MDSLSPWLFIPVSKMFPSKQCGFPKPPTIKLCKTESFNPKDYRKQQFTFTYFIHRLIKVLFSRSGVETNMVYIRLRNQNGIQTSKSFLKFTFIFIVVSVNRGSPESSYSVELVTDETGRINFNTIVCVGDVR